MSKKFQPIMTPAIRTGDLTVDLKPEGAQTRLTVTWKEGTAVQEGASQLSVLLNSADLGQLLDNALKSKHDESKIEADDLTISAGARTRSDAARATPQPDDDPANQPKSLEVKFYSRSPDDTINEDDQTVIPAVEFSKANYVYGLEYMEEWRATWQRAIALAWSDPGDAPTTLKSQLLANPFHFFKTYCNYALPPTVDLLVVDAMSVMPQGESWGFIPQEADPANPNASSGPDWKWRLPRSVLIMFLPPPPTDDKIKAVALAAYEAVGKSYPFTMTS